MKKLFGLILYILLVNSCKEKSVEKKLIKPKTKFTSVSVVNANTTTFKNYIETTNNIQSDKNILLRIEKPGMLKHIFVKEGATVKKGQKLASINQKVIQTSFEELKLNLKFAEKLYQKQQKLWEQKIGSELNYLESKNRKETLSKKLDVLRAQLEMGIITAPFDGKIDEIFLKENDMCSPSVPVMRIINTQKVYVKVDISEQHLNNINKNNTVTITFENLKKSFTGKIIWISDYINPNNRSFKIRIDIKNPNGFIKPNLIAKVKINHETLKKTIVLSNHILQQDMKGNHFVYIVYKKNNNYFAKKTIVTKGNSYAGKTVILSGLKKGQSIVDKGAMSLKNNAQIKF